MTRPTPRPRTRIVGLDVARCLALLGMIATHVIATYDEAGERSWAAELAGGRASALFAVLAGVSLALMSGGARPVRGRERAGVAVGLLVRAVLIAALGLWLGGRDSGVAVILTYYGVLFCLGIAFLGLRARALFVLAGVWALVGPVVSFAVRPELPERGYDSPTFAHLTERPAELLAELTVTGYYPVLVWLAYLLLGMAIGRLDLRRTMTAARLALVGLALALAAPVVSRLLVAQPAIRDALRDSVATTWTPGIVPGDLDRSLEGSLYGNVPTDTWAWLAVANPHASTPLDLARTGGSALLVIGVCVLAARVLPRLWAIAFGAGAMTLTLYSLHVVLLGEDVWTEGPDAFARQVALALVVGAVFAVVRRRGPLEAVVAAAGRTVRNASHSGMHRGRMSP